MSSAATLHCRKRRHNDAHEGSCPSRRRRLLGPSSLPTVRSFAIRAALDSAPHRRGCKRRLDDATALTRLCRRCSSSLLSPSPFPAVRPFSLRVALITPPRRRRKLRVDDARQPVSTPRRRHSHNSLLPRVRSFPGVRPFALRFLLATCASAPRRRWKPAEEDMGNYVSRLLRKSNSDSRLEVHRERLDGPEVVDLTVESDLELEKVDVVGRGIGDWSVPAHDSSRSPEKGVLFYKEALEWAKKRDGGLQESGFEVRLQKLELAELLDPLDSMPKKELSQPFTPLSDKEEREVKALLYDTGHSDKIIVIHEPSNIEITKEKLQCLRPCGWLNDEVINLYIELLKERAEREPKRFLKCHFFNTFFYKKLTCGKSGYDYQSVRRWTTSKKLGYGLIECEKIFVPVHRDLHWCVAVINMKDKTFQYLDSLGGLGHDVLRVLVRYIMDELKDKNNIEVDPNSWVGVSDSLPLQQNGWDCGMFMIKYIDFHSRGLKPSFSQKHMMYFRERTAKEIMALRAD